MRTSAYVQHHVPERDEEFQQFRVVMEHLCITLGLAKALMFGGNELLLLFLRTWTVE